MNDLIQTNYRAGNCGVPASTRSASQAGTRGGFLDLAAQVSRKKAVATADSLSTALGAVAAGGFNAAFDVTAANDLGAALGVTAADNLSGAPGVSAADGLNAAAGATAADEPGTAEAVALESMLKAKYPGLVYHVFDASSSDWRTRNDYPHYLLYQEGDAAKETLENWEPVGANPFYGSIDGRFTAPKEIHALGNVPPGSKAVVIHPAVQERMAQDPAYAREIMAKIDAWFRFDAARNEAIRPGCSAELSQAVAIGEDGNICNACTSSGGGTITRSSDEMARAYYLRLEKRAHFMHWLFQQRIEDGIQARGLAAAAAARPQLAEMLSSGDLQGIFGDAIAGVPTEIVLSMAQAQVWGGVAVPG